MAVQAKEFLVAGHRVMVAWSDDSLDPADVTINGKEVEDRAAIILTGKSLAELLDIAMI